MSYIPSVLCALVAAVSGLLFVLSFVAWCLCEPAIRRGRFRPRPLPLLLAFTVLCACTYLSAP